MKTLHFDEMNNFSGGKTPNKSYAIGFSCAGAIIGAGLLYSNPVTGTLAAMGRGFFWGSLVGACAGFLSID